MSRQMIALLLAFAMNSALAATPEERTRKLTEKVSSIPEGAVVDVRTIDNPHLKGRIGQMTETGFSVQIVRNEKVEMVDVEYKDAKSVKVLAVKDERRVDGKKTAGWVVLGA